LKQPLFISLAVAGALGLAIAWVDSRPSWDDTGISVIMIFAAAACCGFLSRQRPWLIGIATGIWIPLHAIVTDHNFGSILAIIPALVGAYAGYLTYRLLSGN
jgi:hypothetical protein